MAKKTYKTKKRSRNTRKKHIGGFISSPAAYPMGQSWGTPVHEWAGVMGDTSAHGNYYSYNTKVEQLPESTSNTSCGPCTSGGRLKKRQKQTNKKTSNPKKSKSRNRYTKKNKRQYKNIRGGSILQPFVNAYRNAGFQAHQLINSWKGLPAPTNPMPTSQKIPNNNIQLNAINIDKIHTNAEKSVIKL